MYTDGPSVITLFLTCAIFIFFIVILVLSNVKKIVSRKYVPVFAFLILSILAFIVRSLNPAILLTTFIITVINVLMYHTIENPDVKWLREMKLAKDMAEKANKHKSDFLSSMSHEIRTPLNAIVGLSEINIESNDIEEIKENSKDILSASNILLEIVGNVLDMSRIESGNVKIVNTDYNPYDIFNNVTKIINIVMMKRIIQLNINIALIFLKLCMEIC